MIVLDLAEKAGKLIPADVQGGTRVVQWWFAAVSTVAPTLICLDLIGIFDQDAGVSVDGSARATTTSRARPSAWS